MTHDYAYITDKKQMTKTAKNIVDETGELNKEMTE